MKRFIIAIFVLTVVVFAPIVNAADKMCFEAGVKDVVYSVICLDGQTYTTDTYFFGNHSSDQGLIVGSGYAPYVKFENGNYLFLIDGKPTMVNSTSTWSLVR